MPKNVIVIGSGFAGLSTACFLARDGYNVTVLEKNEGPGGRASQFKAEGFTFDMGPSWYWMPDVFDRFFGEFGKKVSDYYQLDRLSPSYQIYFSDQDKIDIPADVEGLYKLFESLEPGCSPKLDKFLKEGAYKYQVGIHEMVYKPGRSIFEFMDFRILTALFKMHLLKSMRKYVYKLFKNDKIRKILEFPVYFLGALPQNTPALYSIMSYADLKLGTWYPRGGMFEIVKGMVALAEELGVKFHYNHNVERVEVANGTAKKVVTSKDDFEADIVVAGADYHHVEQKLLEPKYRRYNEKYWDKRVMAPSSMIFYLGVNKKIEGLKHHNLFFDRSFDQFGHEIYTDPQWPSDPLYYVCVPSKSDDSVAPEGHENVFILIPVAPGLQDSEELKERYFNMMIDRLEKATGQSIRDHVVYKRAFAHSDFKDRYNAFKGNAYGLANTLMQTALLKPKLKSKVSNLYFTGQLTTPGPGVPPSIISGQVVSREIRKEYPLDTMVS